MSDNRPAPEHDLKPVGAALGHRLEGPRPQFTRGELELILEAFSNPQLLFPAHRGRDAAGVLEKTARALGRDE